MLKEFKCIIRENYNEVMEYVGRNKFVEIAEELLREKEILIQYLK